MDGEGGVGEIDGAAEGDENGERRGEVLRGDPRGWITGVLHVDRCREIRRSAMVRAFVTGRA